MVLSGDPTTVAMAPPLTSAVFAKKSAGWLNCTVEKEAVPSIAIAPPARIVWFRVGWDGLGWVDCGPIHHAKQNQHQRQHFFYRY